ncbi:Threonine--tRNA ligase [Buchnera aphidicola (Pterocallis alni)]|uniref:threonine--tRNA ligase n=1 Tax=Buchnera aphidicola TaxID=9 RepID=UPI003464E494
MPVITLLNGRKMVYKHIVSLIQIAEDMKPGLSKIAVGALVNGVIVNIHCMVWYNANVYILTMYDTQSINLIRYSCIQLLSYACKLQWSNAKIATGCLTQNGFYCDIDINHTINQSELFKLEQLMYNIVKKNYDILFQRIQYDILKNWFRNNNEMYKLYCLEKNFFTGSYIPIYYHENYVDFYYGPQVSNIKFCTYFKLQSISGAYWGGNKSNKMLQRIYGTAWLNQNQLSSFLNQLEILKNRDHRLINKKMKLYHIAEDSSGMVVWHKNGLIIFQALENLIRRQLKQWEYQEVKTPIVMNSSMWKVSGHIDHFHNSMFYTESEGQRYCLKPMNCPAHVQIFNSSLRSYRDLPIRIAEFGVCHRNEYSGSLHGLLRLKSFTQDDGHIFCTPLQVQSEIINCIRMILNIYKIFGFHKVHVKLSTRPKNKIGTESLWNQAESDLRNALLNSQINFQYQIGAGAFYGPKIEFVLEDCLNRFWQCGTIQLDFSLPYRFSSYYIDYRNNRQIPIMIHRAIFGSIERFIGILLEQYAGCLPIWLCPIQVVIISVHNSYNSYIFNIYQRLYNAGIRVQYDIGEEKINFKIRKYVMEYVPYILICGAKEVHSQTVSVRIRRNSMIQVMNLDFFINKIHNKIITYSF